MKQHIRFEFNYSYEPNIYRYDDDMYFMIKNAVSCQNSSHEIFIAFENISLDLAKSEFENVTTEYEDKFMSQGLKIFRCEAKLR